MILSKEYKLILLQNPGVNALGLYKVFQGINEANHVRFSPEGQIFEQSYENKFTNNYWGTQKIYPHHMMLNLQASIDGNIGNINNEDLAQYKAYCIIAEPVRRFIDFVYHIKKNGHWIRMLFQQELDQVGSADEKQMPINIVLHPQEILPLLSPEYQAVVNSITYDQIAERVIDYPFINQIFDALRMPQSYYTDPRVEFIALPNLRDKILAILDERNITKFRYIAPPVEDHPITESDINPDTIEKVKLVYAEDVELYNTALNNA